MKVYNWQQDGGAVFVLQSGVSTRLSHYFVTKLLSGRNT